MMMRNTRNIHGRDNARITRRAGGWLIKEAHAFFSLMDQEEQLARQAVSGLSFGFSTLLKVAQFSTDLGFKVAKTSTQVGLELSRQVLTGSDRTEDTILNKTFAVAEVLALQGIEVGHFWADFGLGVAKQSIQGVDHIFGHTETALAVKDFLGIVHREMQENNLYSVSKVRLLECFVGWVKLQSLTRQLWLEWMLEATRVHDSGLVLNNLSTTKNNDSTNENQTNGMPLGVKRYIKFAVGAYGKDAVEYMKDGTIPLSSFDRFKVICTRLNSSQEITDQTNDKLDHFSNYVKFEKQDLFHSSLMSDQDLKHVPSFYLLLDHDEKQVLVVLRGTLSFHDLMVDLSCAQHKIDYNGIEGHVHAGMWKTAKAITDPDHPSRVHEAIQMALSNYSAYGLTLVGHSLGAGVAALMTLIWGDPHGRIRDGCGLVPGRPIQCIAYGCPKVFSLELVQATQAFVTSFVIGSDIVPRLGLASTRDVIKVLLWLDQHPEFLKSLANNETSENHFKTRLAIAQEEMTCKKLYSAGTTFWYCQDKIRLVVNVEQVFGQMLFDQGCISDHLPTAYESVLTALD